MRVDEDVNIVTMAKVIREDRKGTEKRMLKPTKRRQRNG
jgi:hypothetical protein